MPNPAFFAAAVVACLWSVHLAQALPQIGHDSAVPQGAPLLSIGAADGDSLYQFDRINSALRLSDGHIVIADGSSRLRWFDRNGKFVRSVGRRGQGPNEFGRSIFIYEQGKDTIVVRDGGNKRFHYIDRNGRFFRTDTAGDSARAAFVYDRIIVERTPDGLDSGRIRSVAASIQLPQGVAAMRAIPDAGGGLWVRAPQQQSAMTGYTVGGALLGTRTLPPRFQPYQIIGDLILGKSSDSLDVERIELRRILPAPATAPRASAVPRLKYDSKGEMAANETVFLTFRRSLRNLLTAQEVWFSRHREYANTMAELQQTAPRGQTVTILAASATSHWIMIADPTLRATCMVAVGSEWPMGYVEVCG